MFRITQTGQRDLAYYRIAPRWWFVSPAGWGNYVHYLYFPRPSAEVTMECKGFRPVIGAGLYDHNQFGDNSCEHFNVKGDVRLELREPKWADTFVVTTVGSVDGRETKTRLIRDSGKTALYVDGTIDCGTFGKFQTSERAATLWGGRIETGVPGMTAYFLQGLVAESMEKMARLVIVFYQDRCRMEQWFVSPTLPNTYENCLDRVIPDEVIGVSRVLIQRFLKGTSGASYVFPLDIQSSFHLPLTKSEIQSRVHKAAEEALLSIEDEGSRLEQWGYLAEQACLASKKVTSNTLSTLLELVGMKGEIQDLIDALIQVVHGFKHVRPKTVKKLIRDLSDLRLSLKWGLPLTVSDSKQILERVTDEIVRELSNDEIAKVHATMKVPVTRRGLLSEAAVERQRFLTVYYSMRDSREIEAVRWLFDWGFLSLENGWDMIPYSFVVDWFTSFGDKVATLDNILYRTSFQDMHGSVRTTKTHIELPDKLLSNHLGSRCFSNLSLDYYVREINPVVPLPIFSAGESRLGAIQYLDGASLILQRVT